MIGEYHSWPALPLGGMRSAVRGDGRASAPRLRPADVAEAMRCIWALQPGTLAALLHTLPSLVGLTASAAREALGLAPLTGPAASERGMAIAVLPVFGPIWPRSGLAALLGLATADRLAARFRQLVNDPTVSAIVLDVDSPGGVVQGTDELSAEIFKARGTKPIVAVANHLAASAAYWVASAADELVVTPSSESGAIGVYAMHEDISRMLDQRGIKTTLIGAGERKLDGHPYEPLSDRARADLQGRVDDYYRLFVDRVARNRGASAVAVRNGFGEGRVVGARQAVALRMADRIGTLGQIVGELQGGKRRPRATAQAGDDADFRRRRARFWRNTIDESRTASLLAEVDPAAISADVLARAEAALRFCRRDLGLPGLALRWFAGDSRRYTLGTFSPARPDEIWLSDVLTAADVTGTVAHEARHAHQYATLPAGDFKLSDAPAARAWREHDARTYAEHVARRF